MGGSPIAGWFIVENPIKMDGLVRNHMTHVCMQRGCVCYVCCFAGGAGMAFECLVSYLGFQKTVCHGKVRAS